MPSLESLHQIENDNKCRKFFSIFGDVFGIWPKPAN